MARRGEQDELYSCREPGMVCNLADAHNAETPGALYCLKHYQQRDALRAADEKPRASAANLNWKRSPTMKAATAIAVVCLLVTVAFAKDHSANYQVGTVTETRSIQDVNIYGSALANASTAFSHNEHLVTTDDGVYVIEAPTSTGGSILMALATNNQAPTDIHIRWFMDDMRSGDKVLFYAECNKRNDCAFYLPKPDKAGKEFHTNGHFYPNVAKTNTTQLCGTGKLSAAVAAQVCK